jgi:hypothetical protein
MAKSVVEWLRKMKVEVAEEADEGGDNSSPLLAEVRLEFRYHSMMGRTSIAPRPRWLDTRHDDCAGSTALTEHLKEVSPMCCYKGRQLSRARSRASERAGLSRATFRRFPQHSRMSSAPLAGLATLRPFSAALAEGEPRGDLPSCTHAPVL